METTFEQLGIPFPLFEARIEDAREFAGRKQCPLCRRPDPFCFRLGIGGAVLLPCPVCATVNGLDAYDRADAACRSCGTVIAFPANISEEFLACYECLRGGRAAMTKDTELGMVSWEQAFEGVTHGVPGLYRPEFEMVPREDDWVAVRLPQAVMFELLHTPGYSTIQGERWLFCCRAPMVYLGEWSREEFLRRAPDGDGRGLFDRTVEDIIPGLWEDVLHDVTGVYVFRCSSCGCLKAHWDLA